MKKTELKKILKPLVKECIKEVMFEDGMLSGIISEVARGMNGASLDSPKVSPPERNLVKERMHRNAFSTAQTGKLKEHKQKLMEAIGKTSFNGADLFEGTTPAPAQTSPREQAAPLSGHASGDAGVDITNLFGAVGNHWGAHMKAADEGK